MFCLIAGDSSRLGACDEAAMGTGRDRVASVPTWDPTSVGTYGVTSTISSLTVNVHTSGSITFRLSPRICTRIVRLYRSR